MCAISSRMLGEPESLSFPPRRPKECPVVRSAMLIEPETDCLTGLRFDRTLGVHARPAF